MQQKTDKKLLLWSTFGIYMICKIIALYFHEAWFDEMEAWNMAKSLSIREFLVEFSHYEGHPPVWHFLLMPFAKLGCSGEITLKIMTFLFTSIATWILIFRSPLPVWTKVLLPFSYFPFYQYGVLGRPYCMTYLAFVLAAASYKRRDERPWPYVLSLALLCGSTVYGMFFAAGLCLLWAFQLIRKYRKEGLGGAMFLKAPANP